LALTFLSRNRCHRCCLLHRTRHHLQHLQATGDRVATSICEQLPASCNLPRRTCSLSTVHQYLNRLFSMCCAAMTAGVSYKILCTGQQGWLQSWHSCSLHQQEQRSPGCQSPPPAPYLREDTLAGYWIPSTTQQHSSES
jgi:hypothetical protein